MKIELSWIPNFNITTMNILETFLLCILHTYFLGMNILTYLSCYLSGISVYFFYHIQFHSSQRKCIFLFLIDINKLLSERTTEFIFINNMCLRVSSRIYKLIWVLHDSLLLLFAFPWHLMRMSLSSYIKQSFGSGLVRITYSCSHIHFVFFFWWICKSSLYVTVVDSLLKWLQRPVIPVILS
jgi:hypothetical protein